MCNMLNILKLKYIACSLFLAKAITITHPNIVVPIIIYKYIYSLYMSRVYEKKQNRVKEFNEVKYGRPTR